MKQMLSPKSHFENAKNYLQKAKQLNDGYYVYETLAQIYRRQAEWHQKENQNLEEDVRLGHEAVDKGIALNNQQVEIYALKGFFTLLQARLAADAKEKVERAGQAEALLAKALKQNHTLNYRYLSLLDEAKNLAIAK
jgi:hypothetical protein